MQPWSPRNSRWVVVRDHTVVDDSGSGVSNLVSIFILIFVELFASFFVENSQRVFKNSNVGVDDSSQDLLFFVKPPTDLHDSNLSKRIRMVVKQSADVIVPSHRPTFNIGPEPHLCLVTSDSSLSHPTWLKGLAWTNLRQALISPDN